MSLSFEWPWSQSGHKAAAAGRGADLAVNTLVSRNRLQRRIDAEPVAEAKGGKREEVRQALLPAEPATLVWLQPPACRQPPDANLDCLVVTSAMMLCSAGRKMLFKMICVMLPPCKKWAGMNSAVLGRRPPRNMRRRHWATQETDLHAGRARDGFGPDHGVDEPLVVVALFALVGQLHKHLAAETGKR